MPKSDAPALPSDNEEVKLLANTLLTFLTHRKVGAWLADNDVIVSSVIQKQLAATMLSREKPAVACQQFLEKIVKFVGERPIQHAKFLWKMLHDFTTQHKAEVANEHVRLILAEHPRPVEEDTGDGDLYEEPVSASQTAQLQQHYLMLFTEIRSALKEGTELPGEYDNCDADGSLQTEPAVFEVDTDEAAAGALGEYHPGEAEPAQAPLAHQNSDSSGGTEFADVEFMDDLAKNPPEGFIAFMGPGGTRLWQQVPPLPKPGTLTGAAGLHSSAQSTGDKADGAAAASSLTPSGTTDA